MIENEPLAEEEPTGDEMCDDFEERHAPEFFAPEDRRSCETDAAALEEMFLRFEAEHSVDALMAIDELSLEDASAHPVREPARMALAPITLLMDVLRKETDIDRQRFAELKARYLRLSRAVGVIEDGRVDHARA